MTAQEQTRGYVSYDQWNDALLDVLLPVLPPERRGASVLLACDDDAVAAAGAELGITGPDSARRLAGAVEIRHHIASTGSVEGVRRCAVQFNALPDRADRVPPFLAACAVMVLAASRMTSADGGSTHTYYKRLWEVLGAEPKRRPPYEFDYAPWLFKYLAQWLDRDLDGARGLLLLPAGGPTQIGCAINQCLFRQRDKEHLAEFFAHRVRGNVGHLDLLRLLQVSSDRHYLTHRAQEVIADPQLHPMARSALQRAFGVWDGTVPDSQGGRSWLGTLHLSVNRRLSLRVSAPTAPPDLDLGEGFTPERISVPLDELSTLADRGLRLGKPGRPGVFLPATGETLVFELSEDAGLVWVKAATRDSVYVLSRSREVQRTVADYLVTQRGGGELPNRWQAFERVPVARLPADLGLRAATVRPPVELAGGLRVAGGWLVGFSPRVEVGDVDESLAVVVDGEWVGEVPGGGQLQLTLAEGDHRVEVGDGLRSFAVHMFGRNPARPAYGQLACSLDARGARTGASRSPREPYVCGAAISIAYEGVLPLLFRGRAVTLITSDGVGVNQAAPPAPRWLKAVGLDADVARWELEVGGDISWVLAGRTAIMVRNALPPELDAAATAAVTALGDRACVRSLVAGERDLAEDTFRTLVKLAIPEADPEGDLEAVQ